MQDETLHTEPQTTPQEGTPTIPAEQTFSEPQKSIKDSLSGILIGVGTIMMVFVIARMLRRQSANRRAHAAEPPRQRPKPSTDSSFGSAATYDRLNRLMTDAEELTRRLAAILDNKAARIEVLIEHADQRLQALEAANAAAQPLAQSHTQDAAQPPNNLSLAEPPPRTPVETPTPDPQSNIDPLHRKVYDLADEGLKPVDIARQIDRPTGQVELILALRRA